MTEEEAKKLLGSRASGGPRNSVRANISLPDGATEEEIRKALEMIEGGKPVYIPLAADLEKSGAGAVVLRETDAEEEAAKAILQSIQPPPPHVFTRERNEIKDV